MINRSLFSSMLCALLMSSDNVLAQANAITLTAGVHLIRAEVARDVDTRAKGLMFREKLPPNQGMLFVFEETGRHCMWMKNTLIPLSVAFIQADGTIANIADMKPHDQTSHCAVKPVPFALEMDRGWFASRGVKAGSRIGGLEKAPPPR
jgi:uncharacterized protein